jgi:uncharacterized membrane protein
VTEHNPVVARYIDRLEAGLAKLSPAERRSVVQDIESHVAEALAAGQPLDHVIESLGPAEELARAYAVELLMHPREDSPKTSRTRRFLKLAGLVAIGSIPTLVIVVVLGSIGISFTLSGVAVFAAGLLGVYDLLPPFVRMDVPPIFAVALGPVMSAIGFVCLVGLMFYVRFVARTIRRVLPAH